MKCLEKDRSRRYDTAAELAADIERFLANHPVAARPPSSLYRFQKLVLRNRLAFGAGTVFFTSLVVGLCVMTHYVIQENDALVLAENLRKSADSDRQLADAARDKAQSDRAQADAARQRAEAALEQSEKDRAAAQASEQKALASQKDAETARRQAEAALQQSLEDRRKADLAGQQARDSQSLAETSRQQAEAAETRATSAAAQIEQATKAAAAETALRHEAESAREQAEAAKQKAEEATAAAEGEAANLRQSISNAIGRLALLTPGDALKAAGVIFTDEDEKQPWAAQFIRQRANWRARQGDWTNAILDFAKVLDLQPDDLDASLALLPLLIRTGDTNQYELLRARLLAQVAGSSTNALDKRVAEYCLLAPFADTNLAATVAALARQAAVTGTNTNLPPEAALAAGLAEYRMGHYAEATNWTTPARNWNDESIGESYSLLAMSLQQLQQTNNARASLNEAAQIVEAKFPKAGRSDLGPDWTEWIIANLLFQEATKLIPQPTGLK
jgi:chemotaxis protein histidine kinase CheA